ncbi:MAG TPA: hypothetical protein VIM11_28645 [Tepidisphaeraceae bacterium]
MITILSGYCGAMFILQPPNPTIIGAPHFPRVIIPNTASPLDEPSIGRVFLARSRQQIADRHAGAEGPRYNYDVAGFRFRLHRVAAGVR